VTHAMQSTINNIISDRNITHSHINVEYFQHIFFISNSLFDTLVQESIYIEYILLCYLLSLLDVGNFYSSIIFFPLSSTSN